MSTVEASVEVQAPVEHVFHRWTQFEELPQFLDGVEDVEQLSSARMAWRTSDGGVERRFDVEVVEQTDNQLVAWSTIEGDLPRQAWVVSFDRVADERTTVTLRVDVDGDSGLADRDVQADLERFKALAEARG